MKRIFTKLFWPILNYFETDEEAINYKKSHRVILIVLGLLFAILSLVSAASGYFSNDLGSLIPVVVFFCVGLVAVVIGALGSNGAVSKIWGTK